MTEPQNPPAKHLRTWRPMAAWTAGILLALGLAWFVGAVAVPVWQTRKVIWTANVHPGSPHPPSLVSTREELGGQESAARRLGMFIRMPKWFTELDPQNTRGREFHDVEFAVRVLGYCGKPAVGPLIWALRHPDPETRLSALWSLRMIGPEAREALPALIAATRDRTELRARQVGVRPLTTVFPLRRSAAAAIGAIGSTAEAATSRLTELLSDDLAEVRMAAAEALGHIGPAAKEGEPALRRLTMDESLHVRVSANVALVRVGTTDPAQLRALIAALGNQDCDRCQVAQVLLDIGPTAKDAVPALEACVKEGDVELRRIAAEALKKIRGEEPPK